MLEDPDNERLRQGDIVRSLFFPLVAKVHVDFVPTNLGKNARVKRGVAPERDPEPDESALLKVVRSPGLILSQSCDLARGGFALATPLQPIRSALIIARRSDSGDVERVKWEDALPEERNDERRRVASQEAYLGLFPIFKSEQFDVREDLIADFRRCVSFSLAQPNCRAYFLAERIASLTRDARNVLQHKLANFFGRYAAADDWHETPER